MKIAFKDLEGRDRTVTFHDSINTLPIKQYQLVQKFSLIDLGVGSTLHDVNRHLTKFDQFLEAKDYESLALERQNLQLNFSFMIDTQVIPLYILSSMVDTVDNVGVSINKESDLDEYYNLFETSTLAYGVVKDIVENQKKSLVTN